jgi:hypothetical protein
MKELEKSLMVVNIYGPYEERRYYLENLIIGGDLNMTISLR